MYKNLLFWVLFGVVFHTIGYSQERISTTNFPLETLKPDSLDTRFREDQFYFGVHYNIYFTKPQLVNTQGLSGGFQLGFLRDMPINRSRTLALALGGGFSFQRFGHNLFINNTTTTGHTNFTTVSSNFNSNHFSYAAIDFPLEIRWRNATPSSFRFWRIYPGARISYAWWHRAAFHSDTQKVIVNQLAEFNKWRYELTLSVGNGTLNFHINYTLNNLFTGASLQGTTDLLALKPLKVGLLFYIL